MACQTDQRARISDKIGSWIVVVGDRIIAARKPDQRTPPLLMGTEKEMMCTSPAFPFLRASSKVQCQSQPLFFYPNPSHIPVRASRYQRPHGFSSPLPPPFLPHSPPCWPEKRNNVKWGRVRLLWSRPGRGLALLMADDGVALNNVDTTFSADKPGQATSGVVRCPSCGSRPVEPANQPVGQASLTTPLHRLAHFLIYFGAAFSFGF